MIKNCSFLSLHLCIVAILVMFTFSVSSIEAKPKHKTKKSRKRATKEKRQKRAADKKKKRAADKHFKKGMKLITAKQPAKALVEFQAAFALIPHPLVLYNIAGAYRQNGQFQEALDAYSKFLIEGDSQLSNKVLQKGREEMQDLLKLVSRVVILTDPKGASVSVDGASYGETPLSDQIVLTPGVHTITASLDGHQSLSRKIRTVPGGNIDLNLLLKPNKKPVINQVAKKNSTFPIRNDAFGHSGTLHLRAGFGNNLLSFTKTGAPSLGLGYSLSNRFRLNLDAIIYAFAAVPQIQYRLFGKTLPISLIAALPVSWDKHSSKSKFFVSGSMGLGTNYSVTSSLALYLTSTLSYAGKSRATTLQFYTGISFSL